MFASGHAILANGKVDKVEGIKANFGSVMLRGNPSAPITKSIDIDGIDQYGVNYTAISYDVVDADGAHVDLGGVALNVDTTDNTIASLVITNSGLANPVTNFRIKITANTRNTYDADKNKYLDLKETYVINHKQDALEMLLEGIKEGLFVPQLHAINHINTDEWFKSIKENEIHQEICKQRCIDHSTISNSKFSFMDECRDFNNEELNTYLRDGNDLFESVFGFKSTSFIPCCNVLPLVDNSVFKNNGITTLTAHFTHTLR